ncbi:MAG: Unknown protein [uncultured Aureispira sp.]|uniref:Uncharacterized protein n=1 Tax=uncultured Aureispira sp. TaxID=1331704 RepID=A0A6S6UI61_9BACT|nr:MAG: Unknown protein [uncultured Aureispira sp.]
MNSLCHEEQHDEAETLFDWLLLSFHENLGHDHLECYSKYEQPDMVSAFQLGGLEPLIVFVCPKVVPIQELSFVYSSDFSFLIKEKLPASYYYQANTALRAPPQYT